MVKNIFDEDLADEGLGSGIESENIIAVYDPFDPSTIHLDTKVVSLTSVLRRIQNKTINLSPSFQRQSVWDLTRKSLLIESMMLRIPLPMFYVAEDITGKWEVVDGLQRLTAITEFIVGPNQDGKGYKLSNLEFWGHSYDGKTFYELERMSEANMIVNHILESELQFTIIKPDTSDKVKRNIFKRINTGGMRLSDQEIRHALNQGIATDFLLKIVNSPIYLETLGKTVKDTRMGGRELILRYISFLIQPINNYKGDMDDFLSNTMKCINEDSAGYIGGNNNIQIRSINLEDIQLKFTNALLFNYKVFGDNDAFRKSFGKDKKSPINKSLFDVWMFYFSFMSMDNLYRLLSNKQEFLTEYQNLLQDEKFSNAISRHGSSIPGVQYRYAVVQQLLEKYL